MLVPLSKTPQSLSQWCGWLIAKVFLQWCCVGKCDWDITWLHWHKFLMGLKVIIGRKDSSADQLLLKDGDEVEEVLGRVVANVIYLIWWYGKTILTHLLLRCMLHDAHYALDDVVYIGEVALAMAIVEDLNLLALDQLVGESEVCHVGTTGRTIDGEEAQTGAGYVVELGIGMGHQLIALLGGGIEADGIVHLIVGGVWDLLVAAIDGGTAGIDQMADLVMAAGLEDIIEAYEIALDIGIGIGDAVSHSCLGGKVDDDVYVMVGEDFLDDSLVGDIALDECPSTKTLYLSETLIL